MKTYLCIDLKTFYASVECVERGLDPFKTDLVVADPDRNNGTICLAITPKMKERGIHNRCRLFEVPKDIKYIIAKPRMNLYIKYSCKIYSIYLKYVSKEDIFVYSIDECFLDITSYLKLYKKTPIELAQTIIKDVYESTGITATAGIGTNLYLTKIALDITAKHVDSHIGYLDEKLYKETLWDHTPLTDFWQIGKGINNRLNKLGLHTMRDISNCNEDILYKEFGINAELLIDHANGKEDVTIKEIKQYKPKNNSLSNSQILFKDYNYIDARKVLIEMIDNLVLILVQKHLYTDNIGFYIGYSNDETSPTVYSHKLKNNTNSFSEIIDNILPYYDSLVKYNPIRRIGITFGNTKDKDNFQESLFDKSEYEKDSKLEETMLNIKKKYGKNSILRAVSYTEGANQRERNKLVGGHNAE